MDATSFLENPKPAAPVDLSGLSPEEIRGVSGSRIARDQGIQRMMEMLAGQAGRESTIAAQKASAGLARARQKEIENPEMSEITDPVTKKTYKVKRADITSSLKDMANIERLAKAGELDDERLSQLKNTIPTMINGKSYNLSTANYIAITKSIADGKVAEQKQTSIDNLAGLTFKQMTDPDHIQDLMTANPNAFTAYINSRREGLTPGEEARFTGMEYNLGQKLFGTEASKENPDDSDIASYNAIGRSLKSHYGALKVPKTKKFMGIDRLSSDQTQAVSVPLPPGYTMEDVYRAARLKKVRVQDELLRIYNNNKGVSK